MLVSEALTESILGDYRARNRPSRPAFATSRAACNKKKTA